MSKQNESGAAVVERKKARWTQNGGTLEVVFPDGVTAAFEMGKVKDKEILNTLLGYGLKQKLADSTAKGKDLRLTTEERVKMMEDTFENLVKGIWAQKSGGKSMAWTVGKKWTKDEVTALAKVKDLPGMGQAKKAWDAIPTDVREKFGFKD